VRYFELCQSSSEARAAAKIKVSQSAPVFREPLMLRLRRWMLGSAYALVPKRIGLLPRLLFLSVAHLIAPEAERERLPEQPTYYSKRGLVGISNDLAVGSLLENYKRGYFPVSHLGAMKWWCPEERAVIDPADTHVGRQLRQHRFRLSFDEDFASVMEACAQKRPRCLSPGSRRGSWKPIGMPTRPATPTPSRFGTKTIN